MTTDRDFAVSVFVIRNRTVLLHQHKRLNRWLPPGGHVDPGELPDESAIREVLEETGVAIELVGDQLNTINQPGQPRQLVRPMGIQLADISDGHQHIDLVYLARGLNDGDGRGSWFAADELAPLDLTAEIREWCAYALSRLA